MLMMVMNKNDFCFVDDSRGWACPSPIKIKSVRSISEGWALMTSFRLEHRERPNADVDDGDE